MLLDVAVTRRAACLPALLIGDILAPALDVVNHRCRLKAVRALDLTQRMGLQENWVQLFDLIHDRGHLLAAHADRLLFGGFFVQLFVQLFVLRFGGVALHDTPQIFGFEILGVRGTQAVIIRPAAASWEGTLVRH